MARYRRAKSTLGISPFRVSEREKLTGLTPENLKRGLEQFHQNGVVIMENAISIAALDHIRTRMLQDLPRNLSLPKARYNQGRTCGNITQTPPLHPEYLHEEIWANRCGVELMEYIIGPQPELSFATSNIALPHNQGRQAVHSDYFCKHLDFPVFLEVNVFLDDVSPQNGSTELWLGTHEGFSKKDHSLPTAGWIKQEVFLHRAKTRPPIQPDVPKGSICIRDLRLWHSGMPNNTSVPRIMLGFIYGPRWFGSRMRLRLPRSARSLVNAWSHISCAVEFVEDDMDYLEFQQNLLLSQEQPPDLDEDTTKCTPVAVSENHYWSSRDDARYKMNMC